MHDINVIIFLGSLIGPTYYAERLVEFLRKRRIPYCVVNINLRETYDSALFDRFAKQRGTVMCTFNNVGLLLNDTDGTNYWKKNNIPVFDYIVDHPRNFEDSMLEPPCDLYVFTLDRDHKEYIRRFYPKVKGAYFSPNGGTDIGIGRDYKDRNIDVLYMGSCGSKITGFPPIDFFKDKGVGFYREVIDLLIDNTDMSVESAIELYFLRYKIDHDDVLLRSLNNTYAGFIDIFVRRRFKLMGMKALDNAGVHVDIWGNDWEDDEYPFSPNITIHDRVGREDMMEIITHSKISLCFIPWFKCGCSEKNFDSMLNGALCVTDRSKYLDDHYLDGYNIVYFDLNAPAQMAADVRWLLDNPKQAEIIAQRGYETALKYDTWDCRFETLIDTMDSIVHRC